MMKVDLEFLIKVKTEDITAIYVNFREDEVSKKAQRYFPYFSKKHLQLYSTIPRYPNRKPDIQKRSSSTLGGADETCSIYRLCLPIATLSANNIRYEYY